MTIGLAQPPSGSDYSSTSIHIIFHRQMKHGHEESPPRGSFRWSPRAYWHSTMFLLVQMLRLTINIQKGFNVPQHAEFCHKLMLALGYSEYVTQGGDLGYSVTRAMALQYPQSCKATHINMAIPAEPTLVGFTALYAKMKATPLTPVEEAGIARSKWFQKEGSAYFKLQATKPQTIGYSMTDSPVGLLAWIYEKLHDWLDDYHWTDDEVLTWISIYYFSTAGPAASQRIYNEFVHDPEQKARRYGKWIPDVRLGVARFPKELTLPPKLWHQTMGPLVFESEHESGGHFAAFERPDAIVDDLRNMFGKGGGAFGVVKGRSGFDEHEVRVSYGKPMI